MTQLYFPMTGDTKLVCAGSHLGHPWVITSNGSHPCAYVSIPTDRLQCVNWQAFLEKIAEKIECHGGVSYTGISIEPVNFRLPDTWWVGWDYAHPGDCQLGRDGKKWSKEEIKDEIEDVVEQIETLLGVQPKSHDRLQDRFRGIVQ